MSTDETKIDGLGEALPEVEVTVKPSTVRKAVEDWRARKRMLGIESLPLVSSSDYIADKWLDDLIDDIEKALTAEEEAADRNEPPLLKLVRIGILDGYENGMVDGVAFATVGPEEKTGFMWHCPVRQNTMAGAISQLQFSFSMGRHMDMLAQQRGRR